MDDVLALRLDQLDRDPTLQPWLLRAMALRSGEMVGHIGFHTSPGAEYLEPWRPRGVEFGFTVYAPHRRRGYAREASLALMDWAHREHGARHFVLTISPDNLPSQRLAAGRGFSHIGEHIDELDGIEHILARTLSYKARMCMRAKRLCAKTSVVPVLAEIKSFESWGDPIDTIVVSELVLRKHRLRGLRGQRPDQVLAWRGLESRGPAGRGHEFK
jgi:RimJ/RimL family protein N-acetyltransferase